MISDDTPNNKFGGFTSMRWIEFDSLTTGRLRGFINPTSTFREIVLPQGQMLFIAIVIYVESSVL
jgi:hypothetical protein